MINLFFMQKIRDNLNILLNSFLLRMDTSENSFNAARKKTSKIQSTCKLTIYLALINEQFILQSCIQKIYPTIIYI